eukprot:scaffold33506_cov33-Phaeocystis_antarctica.AAC.1
MYAPGFAISPGVRPIISPGRRARSARSACGPAQRGKMRVLFRELDFSSLFVIPFSFALDTMLLPFIRSLRHAPWYPISPAECTPWISLLRSAVPALLPISPA